MIAIISSPALAISKRTLKLSRYLQCNTVKVLITEVSNPIILAMYVSILYHVLYVEYIE